MSKQVTIGEFISTLRDFQRRVDRDAYKIPEDILAQIRRFIIRTGTIDTTQLLVTYDYREFASGVYTNFLIEPNQRYGRKEGFVEFDRPAYNFRGRKFIEKAIRAHNPRQIFNEITFASFA